MYNSAIKNVGILCKDTNITEIVIQSVDILQMTMYFYIVNDTLTERR